MEAGAGAGAAQGGDRPLLELVRSLVTTVEEDANTVLSNSQLLDILHREFNIPLDTKNELEIDIYVNVLKKFLKSWPRWDEFDRLVKEGGSDTAVREALMQEEYAGLKSYLEQTLVLTQGQIGPIISKLQKAKSKHRTETSNPKPGSGDDQVVMEVTCSREQLNQLFYRRPHPATLTIFHVSEEPAASKISLDNIKLKEILNWPHVAITVTLPNFEFTRRNTSRFDRTLVNRKLPENKNREYEPLSSQLYWKPALRKKEIIRKKVMVSFLVQLIVYIDKIVSRQDRRKQLFDLFNEFKNDMTNIISSIYLNAEYQYYMSRHPYVRRLYKEVTSEEQAEAVLTKEAESIKEDIDLNDFELELEEMISPATTFQMSKFKVNFTEDKSGRKFNIDYATQFLDVTNSWLKIECTLCEKKYDGFLSLFQVEQHFNESHIAEPDWQCTKCLKCFTMNFLCASRWKHVCKS